MTRREIALAYEYWRQRFMHKDFDEWVERLIDFPKMPWIRVARQALFLKPETVAKKLGISPAALHQAERGEASGNLKLKTLEEIAAAMDCEVVYVIRPKNRKRFSQVIWPQLYPHLLDHHWLTKCAPARKPGALAALAHQASLSPKFRRERNWCRRKP